MLLPALSDLTLAAAREGVLAGWAVLDAKREVRVAGAVGVPLLPSRDSFRMLEMSSLAEVEWGWAEPEGLLGGSSARRWREVVNVRAFWHWSWGLQCRAMAANRCWGCLYAAGARKGNNGCDERRNASPALYRSITTRDTLPSSSAELGSLSIDVRSRKRRRMAGEVARVKLGGEVKVAPRHTASLMRLQGCTSASLHIHVLRAPTFWLLGILLSHIARLAVIMAYNYGPPGAYGGRQPSYGFPPGANMGGPPGMAPAPGMDAPPGMTAQSPAGGQMPFQAPIPGVNMNAPVIRLGVDQKPGTPADRIAGGGRGGDARGSNAEPLGGRSRAGLGADGGSRNLERDRAAIRENMLAIQPPTREEVARTIFVGDIVENAPSDEAIENILRCAGKLRRWTRARNADDQKCKFGFAEYEDVDSLEAANEIFGEGIEVPALKSGRVIKQEEDGETHKITLSVVVDEQSQKYIEEWTSKRKEEDDARQFRLDSCKEDLQQCIAALANADAFMANAGLNGDADGEVKQANGDEQGAEVVNIPLGGGAAEDELNDIPEEMRATVAAEIKAFRDRSIIRDKERLKKEEEMEQQERQRSRINRLASPPLSGAPSGPASSTNGIPVGPRGAAPSGPKGYRGAQMPSDYANGVAFVGTNGATNGISLNREDDDAEESDEELEARRQRKHEEELEKRYLDQERRWLNRERNSAMARERQRKQEQDAKDKKNREKDAMLKRLREWNDDEETRAGREEYYVDRSAWIRKRADYREAEQKKDDADRMAENREQNHQHARDAEARGQADAFLDQMGEQMASRNEPAQPTGPSNFKLSLGSAAAKTKAAATAPASRRPAAFELEGLLEDDEDNASNVRKPALKPLDDTSTLPTNGADLSDEDRAAARAQLAAEIPSDVDALFAHKVRWEGLTPEMLEEQVRPMVEKRVMEYLGVQEEFIVDAVVGGIKKQTGPEELVGELEPVLEDEARVMMKKVWRLVVFLSESQARGLN